jgi:hypothetical protein
MIIVRVELWSSRNGARTELARMEICNDETGTPTLRNYVGRTLRGRSTTQLNLRATQREAALEKWPSARLHVWYLVAAMLRNLGYGRKPRAGNMRGPCSLLPEDIAA